MDLKVGCWVAHLICDIIQAAGDSDAMVTTQQYLIAINTVEDIGLQYPVDKSLEDRVRLLC